MRALLIVLCLMTIYGPVQFAADGWETLAPMPEGLAGMVAYTTDGGDIAYHGGSGWKAGEKFLTADGWKLHDGQWLPLPPLPNPVAFAAFAQEGAYVLSVSGLEGESLCQAVFQVSVESGKIEATALDHDLAYAPGVFCNGIFYTIGGSLQHAPLQPTALVHRLDGSRMVPVAEYPDGPLLNAAACAMDQRIYVFGGGSPSDDGTFANRSDAFALDPETNRWQPLAPLPSPLRGAVAVALPGHGILILGGYRTKPEGEAFSREVWLYDTELDSWRRLTDLPIPVMLPAVQMAGDYLYFWGGEDAKRSRSRATFRIRLARLLGEESP